MGTDVYVGCCGWAGSQSSYFREFGAVEIQQTFYDPPRPETLARWRAQAPEAFRFCLKCFQLVTHESSSPTYRRLRRPAPRPRTTGSFRQTREVRRAWEETVEAARALEAEVIVLQTPASFTPTDRHLADLHAFCAWARQRAPCAIAFEPRGAAWEPRETDRLCDELGLLRACDPFAVEPPDARRHPTAYFRLHGVTGYRYVFTDNDLATLREIVLRYRTAWVFFNNLAMRQDARRFLDHLGGPAARGSG